MQMLSTSRTRRNNVDHCTGKIALPRTSTAQCTWINHTLEARVGKSLTAPTELQSIRKMNKAKLVATLGAKGLPTQGTRKDVCNRLLDHVKAAQEAKGPTNKTRGLYDQHQNRWMRDLHKVTWRIQREEQVVTAIEALIKKWGETLPHVTKNLKTEYWENGKGRSY